MFLFINGQSFAPPSRRQGYKQPRIIAHLTELLARTPPSTLTCATTPPNDAIAMASASEGASKRRTHCSSKSKGNEAKWVNLAAR
jgi:hypothetical protein